MKKHTPAPEGYYDDDAEALDDLDDLDQEAASLRTRLRQRVVAVFGTSYGISAAVHLAILLVLATIIITSPPVEESAELHVRPRDEPPRLEEERKPDLKDQPEVPLPETVETPVDITDPEVEITLDMPQGIELDAASDRTVDVDARSLDQAYGLSGAAAGAYGKRFGQGRPEGEGGGPATEDAVRGALEWLARHQAPDGSWQATWSEQCKADRCQGGVWENGGGAHPVGYTALSVLAFLGNGHTHRFAKVKKFRDVVRKALRYLRAEQRPDGSIGWGHVGENVYDHAIATMALCEAFAITRDFELKGPALRATEYLLAAQNPGLGWKYGVRSGRNDSSVTGWCVLALKAAHMAGFTLSPAAFEGARAWFQRATDSAASTGYETPGGGSSFLGCTDGKYDELPVNTAVALLCRLLMGERRSEDVLRRATSHLRGAPPTWPAKDQLRKVNFYYWYYGTYAMFQMGGQPWHDWNDRMKEALLPQQRQGGCADGSWDPDDPWSPVGGRVYATAINALTLEIYYRYERAKETPALDQVTRPR